MSGLQEPSPSETSKVLTHPTVPGYLAAWEQLESSSYPAKMCTVDQDPSYEVGYQDLSSPMNAPC